MENLITSEIIERYGRHLREEARAEGTVEKYLRDVSAFAGWLDGREVSAERAAEWRQELIDSGRAPATVNAMIASVNGLLSFLGLGEMKVRYLKIQRRAFRERARELTREEYQRLLGAAERRGARLRLLMETICGTGIRVSEVRFITVEAAREGQAEIYLKGKVRTVLIPGKLARKLLRYAGERGIGTGEIFLTRTGRALTRRQIWAEMKALCERAGVERSKVFPHNLRHLFAVTFYRACRDIVRLADVLGHSSVEVTRIYLKTTGDEHRRTMERLGLVT